MRWTVSIGDAYSSEQLLQVFLLHGFTEACNIQFTIIGVKVCPLLLALRIRDKDRYGPPRLEFSAMELEGCFRCTLQVKLLEVYPHQVRGAAHGSGILHVTKASC